MGTCEGEAVLWIRDIWYGSGCGSGSSDPYLCLTDPNADLGGPRTYGSYGSGTQVKSHNEVTKQKKSRFFLLFLLDEGRIRIRIPLFVNNGSGCGSGIPNASGSTTLRRRMKFLELHGNST
jgi:hypothetical protein